jgi:hypothetical protein
MADVAITPVQLVQNTRSADLLGAGTAITDAVANVFAIAAGGRHSDRLILIFEADASGDTVTILAGDRPPAERAGLGNVTVELAASDIRAVAVESARFVQDDGSIRATCGDNGTLCYALILPKN